MCRTRKEENKDKDAAPTEARRELPKGCPDRGAGSVPHDRGARNKGKLLRLRMRHGAAGYGVYFMLLERLTEESGHMSVKDYNMIAFDLRVDAALVKSVVEDFGLFAFAGDGKCFHSEGLDRRLAAMREAEETPILTAGKKKARKNPPKSTQGTARTEKPADGRASGKEAGAVQDGMERGTGNQADTTEEPRGKNGNTPCAQKEKDKEKETPPFPSPLPPLSPLSPIPPTPPITLYPTYPSISSVFPPKEKDKEKERPDDDDDETRTHARETRTHGGESPAGDGTEGRRVRVEGFAAGIRQETPAWSSPAGGGRPPAVGNPATSPQGIQPAGHGGGNGCGSGGDPYAGFLRAFFDGHQAAAESLCMQLHTDMDALRLCAERVVDEWKLADARHDGYTDAARHLISQLRIKVRYEAAHGEIPTRAIYGNNNHKNSNGNGTYNHGGGSFETYAERNARIVAERNKDIDEAERQLWQGVADAMPR